MFTTWEWGRRYVNYIYALLYLILQQLCKLYYFVLFYFIFYPCLSEENLELREVMFLFHNHIACQGKSQHLNTGPSNYKTHIFTLPFGRPTSCFCSILSDIMDKRRHQREIAIWPLRVVSFSEDISCAVTPKVKAHHYCSTAEEPTGTSGPS